MPSTVYRDPIIAALITLFNATGPSELKNKYYYGSPIVVPQIMLPAVFISKDGTSISEFAMNVEQDDMEFVLTVIYPMRKDFDKMNEAMSGVAAVWEIIEGRETSGANLYSLKSTALAYIIRANTHLASSLEIDLGEETRIEYGIAEDFRGPGLCTAEGEIRFKVKRLSQKPTA